MDAHHPFTIHYHAACPLCRAASPMGRADAEAIFAAIGLAAWHRERRTRACREGACHGLRRR